MADEDPISAEEAPLTSTEEAPSPTSAEKEPNRTKELEEENSRLSDVISELKEELAGARKMKSALAEIINPAVKESITKLVEEFVRNKK